MDIKKIIFNFVNSISKQRKVKRDYSNPQNRNEELCKKCGGLCCRNCGCHFSPDDFKEITFENLKSEIEKGYISIEWVDEEFICRNTGGYILRVRNVDRPIVDNEYERTPCILLTEVGCKLDYEHRPTGGKLLIPLEQYDQFLQKKVKMCFNQYDIKECCNEWRQYQEILVELAEYFRDKDKDYPCKK